MDVSVQDGIVTLTGTVGSMIMKRIIVDEVSRLPGVRAVQANEFYDDTSLQLVVARALASNPSTHLADDQVYIHVHHGRVVLTGRVSSSAKREAIEETAAAVPGVRGVVNRLKIV